MKPVDFTLERPADLAAAYAAVAEYGDDGKVIAGGQSLIPLLNYRLSRPDYLIDLARIASLKGISSDPGGLVIGSMVTYAELMRSADVARVAPLLPLVLPSIANKAVRNRGTIGGSAAHADPAGEMPSVLSVLDAEIVAGSATGERVIPARDFFQGTFETALQTHEIITSVRLPAYGPGTGFATREVSRRHGDFALVGAFARVHVGADGAITDAAVSMSGVASTPLRLRDVEEHIIGTAFDPAALARAQEMAREELAPVDDLHATADYRRSVGCYIAVQTISDAYQHAFTTNR